jgi:spermidine/putrescine ABC transporter ATP-binding subunit
VTGGSEIVIGEESKGVSADGSGERTGDTNQSPDAVRLSGVSKLFGTVRAVDNVDLSLKAGTLTSLLGPSGCGKTTLLRLVAGLEQPTYGEIAIKGRAVEQLPIHKRRIGLVFQNYALFPHKTIGENIAFGLKRHGVPRSELAPRIRRALEMVRLPGIEERYPNQLSGGQQQRVALARAVVFEPDVLLLDEPLSALDANLRDEMRVEIKLIQKALGLTAILVTHDQQEALSMSDTIVVMNRGSVQQTGNPRTIFRYPANRFVASFLGQSNVFSGTVLGRSQAAGLWRIRLENGSEFEARAGGPDRDTVSFAAHEACDVVIRSSDVELRPKTSSVADEGIFEGTVIDASYLGNDADYLVDFAGLTLRIIRRIGADGNDGDTSMFGAGEAVHLRLRPQSCSIIKKS